MQRERCFALSAEQNRDKYIVTNENPAEVPLVVNDPGTTEPAPEGSFDAQSTEEEP